MKLVRRGTVGLSLVLVLVVASALQRVGSVVKKRSLELSSISKH